MRIDNFYFVVDDIEKSTKFYTKLLNEEPSTITENRWA
ncbi:MAG TPA: VOC family protein, partial [Firmicutes bacterium]|nr:VOC family protein [Bacillota bacterium]